MAEYSLVSHGVRRVSDGAWIPASQDNADWQAYQRWLAAGNLPDPLPPDKLGLTITMLDFIERFSPQEQLAIIQAQDSTPQLKLWLLKASAIGEIDLASPEVRRAVLSLVDAGFMDEERAAAILTPK